MVCGFNDINSEDLLWAHEKSPSPRLLSQIVEISRENFGWFSKHTPRAFEYPWVLLEIGMIDGRRVLDIGSGVSPLPIMLANRGADVTTIDNSQIIRNQLDDSINWNEWGFLDYSILNKRITSINIDYLSYNDPDFLLDCIYSISVMEHLPAAVRYQFWEKIFKQLVPSGMFVLTVDLIPGTDHLWNLNKSKEVESLHLHGDLSEINQELMNLGFIMKELVVLREIKGSRTDCAMMSFSKGKH